MGVKNPNSYTRGFKEAAIQKLLISGKTGKQVAKDLGIPVTTLFCWKQKYATTDGMKNIKRQ